MSWLNRLNSINPLLHRVFGREEVIYCSSVDNASWPISPIEMEGAEFEDSTPGTVMRLEVLPSDFTASPATSDTVIIGQDVYIVARVDRTLAGVYQLTLHKDG